MLIKPRFEPVELKLLRFLNTRMNLPQKDLGHFLNLQKGYEGELIFDTWLDTLSDHWPIMNDLWLETNNTVYQIDSSLISQDTIYLFEVKNFEGDYYLEDDKFHSISGKEIKNPLLQLKRTTSLFRRMLQDLRFSFSIEAYVVFVNPNFFLYQTPKNVPIIFPNQIEGFMKKLNLQSPRQTNRATKFIEKLSSILLEESPYKNLPEYTYDQLTKGITCSSCNGFVSRINRDNLICKMCGKSEGIDSAVLRSLEEYQFLFPDKKITTSSTYEWCKVIDSKKTIRRILKENLLLMKYGQTAYFENPQFKND